MNAKYVNKLNVYPEFINCEDCFIFLLFLKFFCDDCFRKIIHVYIVGKSCYFYFLIN